MPFRDYMNLVPAECNENTRIYIKKKLDELDMSLRNLKVNCNMCKVGHVMFKENREILVGKLRERFPNAMVLLKGKELVESRDYLKICFLQDSYFYWTFGVEKPNLWGAIDVETATSYIFYNSHVEGNKISYSYSYPEHLAKKYKIDKVVSSVDMKYEISKLGRNVFLVLSNMDEKRINEMSHEGVVKVLSDCGLWICNTVLSPVFNKCRMVKSLAEQYIMTMAAKINSEGMVFVLRNMKPGIAGYCTSALFDFYVTSSARHVSKARPTSCLTGEKMFCLDDGRSTSYLNDDLESGDLCILDMGIALRNYRTNLIATVPINGIFSDSQAVVYNIVLEMRSTMLKELKPGITFTQLANIARRTMVKELIRNFILEGAINDIMESGICDVFNPNGIGHFLGIDFYDCEEGTDNHSTKIRGNFAHLVAKKGMVLALNSELYLNEVIIKKWMYTPAAVYLQSRDLSSYFGLAARVQDIVLIKSYPKLLSNLPRTIEEIQNTMSEKISIPFIKYRRPYLAPQKSILKMNLEKFPAFKRKGTDDPFMGRAGKSLLKLRYDYEPEEERRLDLEEVLNMIKERREWKPMECLNQIMKEVYKYPYKIKNMLELAMVPLLPQRRRPTFLPFPEVSPIAQAKLNFPEEGYGCPYFKWNESFESCRKILDACLE